MTINGYAKRWCEEDYDIKKEAFHIDNAYYIAKRQWAKATLKQANIYHSATKDWICTPPPSYQKYCLSCFYAEHKSY